MCFIIILLAVHDTQNPTTKTKKKQVRERVTKIKKKEEKSNEEENYCSVQTYHIVK